jgi:RNA polymerase sigma-70 factor (ECF subfamily)
MQPESQPDRREDSTHTALGSAFRENAAKIYIFIYGKVGNREAAEDLTSQVFLKATRWLASDRSADSIRSWLYTTARTGIVDYWREQGRLPSVPIDTYMDLLFRGTDGPEEVRRTRERAAAILDALPSRERDVLRLRFLRGYSTAEIAQALGLSASNVRVLQLRALRRAAALEDTGHARTPGLSGEKRSEEGGLNNE